MRHIILIPVVALLLAACNSGNGPHEPLPKSSAPASQPVSQKPELDQTVQSTKEQPAVTVEKPQANNQEKYTENLRLKKEIEDNTGVKLNFDLQYKSVDALSINSALKFITKFAKESEKNRAIISSLGTVDLANQFQVIDGSIRLDVSKVDNSALNNQLLNSTKEIQRFNQLESRRMALGKALGTVSVKWVTPIADIDSSEKIMTVLEQESRKPNNGLSKLKEIWIAGGNDLTVSGGAAYLFINASGKTSNVDAVANLKKYLEILKTQPTITCQTPMVTCH